MIKAVVHLYAPHLIIYLTVDIFKTTSSVDHFSNSPKLGQKRSLSNGYSMPHISTDT